MRHICSSCEDDHQYSRGIFAVPAFVSKTKFSWAKLEKRIELQIFCSWSACRMQWSFTQICSWRVTTGKKLQVCRKIISCLKIRDWKSSLSLGMPSSHVIVNDRTGKPSDKICWPSRSIASRYRWSSDASKNRPSKREELLLDFWKGGARVKQYSQAPKQSNQPFQRPQIISRDKFLGDKNIKIQITSPTLNLRP